MTIILALFLFLCAGASFVVPMPLLDDAVNLVRVHCPSYDYFAHNATETPCAFHRPIDYAPMNELVVRYSMRHLRYLDYDNTFQTDEGNAGIRMELSPQGALGLVVGDGTPTGYDGFVVYKDIRYGEWYDIELAVGPGRLLSVKVNGKKVFQRTARAVYYHMENIMVGAGFGGLRRFGGEIKNFEMTVRYGRGEMRSLLNKLRLFTVLAGIVFLVIGIRK